MSLRLALTIVIPTGMAGAVLAWIGAGRLEAGRAALARSMFDESIRQAEDG